MRLISFFIFSTFFSSYTFSETIEAKVITVIDGNTFEVTTKSKETIKFMLFDVDSPELNQAYGQEAKAYVESLLLKKKVKIELKGKDRWGNKLALVTFKNGKNLSEELVKAGFAWVGERYQKITQLKNFEIAAKNSQQGLWADEEIISPWVYRRKQTMLRAKSR